MDNAIRKKEAGDYSSDQLSLVYNLGVFYLENHDFTAARNILNGLSILSPENAQVWHSLSLANLALEDLPGAYSTSRQALRLDPSDPHILLTVSSILMSQGDFTTAGSYLGEFSELVEQGKIREKRLIDFYKILLARFEYKVK